MKKISGSGLTPLKGRTGKLIPVVCVSTGVVVEYMTKEEIDYRQMEEQTARYWRCVIDKRWP